MVVLEGQGRYVEGALRLLQFVESRRPTGRRFGPDAEARWASFKGDLETIDRIELMIRDADAEWPGAFGARSVYGLRGIPEDEPFGARWVGLDPVDGEALWRRVRADAGPRSPRDALAAIARAWEVELHGHDVGAIAANDRLVVAGPSAIAATIEAFADAGAALDWADQVICVATPPVARQLAAAAGAIVNATRPTALVATAEEAPVLATAARLVASADATGADRATAAAIVAAAGQARRG